MEELIVNCSICGGDIVITPGAEPKYVCDPCEEDLKHKYEVEEDELEQDTKFHRINKKIRRQEKRW